MTSSFGFNPDENPEENPPDFAAIFEALQSQLQSQFGQALPESVQKDIQSELEKLRINPAGFLNPLISQTPGQFLPSEVVRDIAKKFLRSDSIARVPAPDMALIKEAMKMADLWLNEATVFPAHSNEFNIYTRAQWIDATLTGWQLTVEPLAKGLAQAMSAIIQEQAQAEGAPPMGLIADLLATFIGTLIATQLGQCIGALATNVTGAHDVGLPLLSPARPALLPENIAAWSSDIGIPDSEIRTFHALREGAVARLFDNNPWLVEYMRTAISDYGRGIHIDIEKIQNQAQNAIESGFIDPNNPETFSIAINQGLFTPEESPAQRYALAKLETALALIDGWADDVTTTAAAGRLPSLGALRETLSRARAASSPAQQLFYTLFGVEVSPRMSRQASTFWLQLRELRDIATRDRIWSGILPTQEELADPASYLTSVEVPDDLSGL